MTEGEELEVAALDQEPPVSPESERQELALIL
jgi:hypothetical protein